ncbi:uncharacterized protein M437DRAFT_67646 [Aureobasidium melanogenum CBS 110374]|uniref:Uncharacterized protein n=1 Tax=Aureobasidium melanogenum (strain CBS 110374) TaxID=1043003 RepID=A0A074VK01_AURM1|nr:uncharacterized protein M437DRAFT_67646 [Aureobasidium melanogenum CBS 110374]KEQ60858.1 hypothetical protein M437DRAFT_67646 [Aureobasidium melanogenum CBS 110374]
MLSLYSPAWTELPELRASNVSGYQLSASSQQAKVHNSFDERIMSVTQQQVPASRTQAAKNDGDVLSSATNSSLVSDNNPSLSSRCMTFQTRIDSYTIELDRLEAMNKAIHKKYDKRKQEQQRDRLIDSASPEPDRGSATVRKDKHKMVLKKLRQRRRRLTRGLAVMKEKMEKLKTEIESVSQEMNVGDL